MILVREEVCSQAAVTSQPLNVSSENHWPTVQRIGRRQSDIYPHLRHGDWHTAKLFVCRIKCNTMNAFRERFSKQSFIRPPLNFAFRHLSFFLSINWN